MVKVMNARSLCYLFYFISEGENTQVRKVRLAYLLHILINIIADAYWPQPVKIHLLVRLLHRCYALIIVIILVRVQNISS